jgi:hypothetical protein
MHSFARSSTNQSDALTHIPLLRKAIFSFFQFSQISIYPLICKQGDQIGRIFAYWAIALFGQFFENFRWSTTIWAALFHGKSFVLNHQQPTGLHFGLRFFSQTHLVTLFATLHRFSAKHNTVVGFVAKLKETMFLHMYMFLHQLLHML